MGRSTKKGESPVCERGLQRSWIQSTAGHEEPGGNKGGPSSKPKYYLVTDREKYCEGKVKRTPGGEWKEPETLCLQAPRAHQSVIGYLL